MKNLRFPAMIMVALVIGFLVMLSSSAHALPERVASHFDASGRPNGWTDRSAFLLLMGGVGLTFPLLFAALFLLARFAPFFLTSASGGRWLAAGPGVTFNYLLRRSFWFGSMILAFIAAVQALILEANAASPPRLQTVTLMIVLAGFTVGVMFWSFSLLHHFSQMRRTAQPLP
ncbi:MAG TPA: DUF1648 domain-containing protein [Verrucomicrobiae bacterium]|jgi:serine/threonine-protein kinase|nr:DUF1648 domain-containing protein [Verrucomicrobiae bacterium]